MLKQLIIPIIFSLCFLSLKAQEQKLFKTYYPDGKIKSISHEDIFNGCNMPVGTDSIFYRSGQLMTTIFYDNVKSKKEEGCHAGWTIATTKTFFKNGKLKSSSQQKYSYEGTPCNCGVWQQKSNKGQIVSRKTYSDCYNQIPCKD